MNSITYTSVDRIIAKFSRDLRGTDIVESDVIEWIGEALEFMKVHDMQEQAIAFLEVENHHAIIPDNFQMVIQIARNNNWSVEDKENCGVCPKDIIEDTCEPDPGNPDCGCLPKNDFVLTDCQGNIIGDYEIAYYRPFFDLKWEYYPWTMTRSYKRDYTPVRLADDTLYNSLVCKEKSKPIVTSNEDSYTIVGLTEKKLRFSFKEGFVAMAYLRNALDPETGYPLVPDQISYMTAITYYVKWKIAEQLAWNGREGFEGKADKAEQKWLKYCKQGTNWMKMPKSLDDYQDLLEQTHQLVPRHKKYYNFFGKVKFQE